MTPEEALRHALLAEIKRMPAEDQAIYAGSVDKMVAAQLAGQKNPLLENLLYMSQVGHPDYRPTSPVTPSRQTLFQAAADNKLQDKMLEGYTGIGWTPSQLNGRTPEPYELSPGGKMKSDIEERQRLIAEMGRVGQGGIAEAGSDGHFFSMSPGAWAGAPNPKIEKQMLADNYSKAMERTHAPGTDIGNQLNNPENWFGTFTTKMGPVLSDAWAQAGSAALDGNPATGAGEAVGDAAARAIAADWNRTNPVLANDRGWRENDALIRRMRQAWMDADGMTASDTVKAMNGGKPLPWGIQSLASGFMSFANGLGDMSSVFSGPGAALTKGAATQLGKTGIPGVANYGRHISRVIGNDMDSVAKGMLPKVAAYSKREVADEALFDPLNHANTIANAVVAPPDESPEQFNARILDQSKARKEAIRTMEANQNEVVRPRKNHGIVGNLLW